jgi:dTDP-glucose 4,6-dehydratase
MKILVTGACGFIGSHLVESLVTKGHNVKAFTFYNSRNSNGWIDNLDKNVKKQILHSSTSVSSSLISVIQ